MDRPSRTPSVDSDKEIHTSTKTTNTRGIARSSRVTRMIPAFQLPRHVLSFRPCRFVRVSGPWSHQSRAYYCKCCNHRDTAWTGQPSCEREAIHQYPRRKTARQGRFQPQRCDASMYFHNVLTSPSIYLRHFNITQCLTKSWCFQLPSPKDVFPSCSQTRVHHPTRPACLK